MIVLQLFRQVTLGDCSLGRKMRAGASTTTSSQARQGYGPSHDHIQLRRNDVAAR